MDAAGREVVASEMVIGGQIKNINISALAAGVYFVKVQNNNFNVTTRLVVK
jgi:hypothetical protein